MLLGTKIRLDGKVGSSLLNYVIPIIDSNFSYY